MTDTPDPPLDAGDAVDILRGYYVPLLLRTSNDSKDATTLERIADLIDALRKQLDELQHPKKG